MPLIDADALKTDVRRHVLEGTDEFGTISVEVAERSFLSLIDRQPAVETELKWIPVEDERKPSDRREYFVAYVFGDSDMHFFGASMYHAHEGNGLVNRPHFSNEGVDEMRVTHWMEIPNLPKPPKGE